MAGLLPFRTTHTSNSASLLIDSFSEYENVCFMLNVSVSDKFLSLLINGNATRGLKAKILLDTGQGSNYFKLKILDNKVYLNRTAYGSLRLYVYRFSKKYIEIEDSDVDLTNAETIGYI